ncbi:hypothetical protein [Amantichitinum ursilacus]|uniref:Restriction endonuclease type IV Mrr domain-containing protein n=1 Tax=Amantichitinum ursilacus TaxID=857265 RepID=A0A0N0XII4_9NEIS|nr:hypothetical protein [Amantichitinum ursilacus]KPC52278.1 hypothetical protein WG78_14505 [Amantichitinum ursilacus]
MSYDEQFPQNWPAHLQADAEIAPYTSTPPLNAVVPLYEDMHSHTFEQMCWWILQKEYRLLGCTRLGKKGVKQYGIDLFGQSALRPGKLIVFECKCWRDFTPKRLRDAVSAFLRSDWASKTYMFVIIMAQHKISGNLGLRWIEQQARLKEQGIESELWTAEHLTERLQEHPDVLSKFFPAFDIATFGNIWMKRVGFYHKLDKLLSHPDAMIAEEARAHLLGPPIEVNDRTQNADFYIDGEIRTVCKGREFWSFKGPWFTLSVRMPNTSNVFVSVVLDWKKHDLAGFTTVLSHTWLLKNFLFAEGAPLDGRYRGFIVKGDVRRNEGRHLIDFPNCRFSLPADAVRELANAADYLSGEIRQALAGIERRWGCKNFPVTQHVGQRVILATMQSTAWEWLLRFAQEHQMEKGDSSWHIFECHLSSLMPCSRKNGEQGSREWYGIFSGMKINGLTGDREVAILWSPENDARGRENESNNWWTCEQALRWFQEELAPAAKRWLLKKKFSSPLSRLFQKRRLAETARQLDSMFDIRAASRTPLLDGADWTAEPLAAATALQFFFSCELRDPVAYIQPVWVTNLYRAAVALTKAERGYVRYAAANLCLEERISSHQELANALNKRIEDEQTHTNPGAMDHILRGILELIGDSTEGLPAQTISLLLEAFEPLAKLADTNALRERYTEYVRF